jgi:hypothetical protein
MPFRTDTHPADGVLRRLVDEPAGVADTDRAHVRGCADCLHRLATVRDDARATAAALDVSTAPDVDRAWRRLSATVSAPAPARTGAPARSRRWRTALRSPVIAGFGVAVVLGGAGAAAAGDWLEVFRTEEVAPLAVSTADLVSLPDLSGYGDLTVVSAPDPQQFSDAAGAEQVAGVDAPRVDELPTGVTGEPMYVASSQVVADFTFSEAKAAQSAAAAGETLPPAPAGLDGSTFRLAAGPGLAEVWESSSGVPALVVARVTAPTAFSSGVPFDTAREYLTSLPGVPDQLAAQLAAFASEGTLPLPVPAELVTTDTAEVDGHEATVLASRDGLMTGVVWVEDGIVTGVAGSLTEDEVLDVARGLS